MPAARKTARKKPATKRASKPATEEVRLAKGIGEVTIGEDGVHHVDEWGLLVRLGEARPSPEWAAKTYPLFELCPGEERPEPGETLAGVPVFCWVDQQKAAELLHTTTRTVQRWERDGLPSRGEAAKKRYPVPHIISWRSMRRKDDKRLPIGVALARQALQTAEEQAEYRRG